MKYTIVLLVALAMALPCQGQDLPDYTSKKNEFNIGYFNLFNLSGPQELGIGYKHMGHKGAFRAATGFYLSLSNSSDEETENIQNGFDISPRIGYEFHQWFGRARVHYGADVVTSFYINKSKTTNDDPDYVRGIKYNSSSIGIRPLLGLTVYIHPSISFATEVFMDIRYEKTVREDFRTESESVQTDKGLLTELGPLGIVSINFHF
jgi:hypothetical protein